MEMTSESVRQVANELGLDLVSIVTKESLQPALNIERERLQIWQDKGHAAEMEFMKRSPDLFTNLENFLPGVRSVAQFCLSYLNEPTTTGDCPEGFARVARYAWGKDYHLELKERLNRFVELLRTRTKINFRARVFSDAVPILERAIASRASLGFVGKNTLIIRPGIGSFTFLAEVLWDLNMGDSVLPLKGGGGCGSCFRCGASCPTGAIALPHQLDASKCISYLTIEKRSEFLEWEELAISDWIFGCDLCQEICPFNHDGIEIGNNPIFKGDNGPFLSLKEVLSLRSDESYRSRFKNSAILRAKRGQLIRNACAVVSNKKDVSLSDSLIEVIGQDVNVLARNSAFKSLRTLLPLLDGASLKRADMALSRYLSLPGNKIT